MLIVVVVAYAAAVVVIVWRSHSITQTQRKVLIAGATMTSMWHVAFVLALVFWFFFLLFFVIYFVFHLTVAQQTKQQENKSKYFFTGSCRFRYGGNGIN